MLNKIISPKTIQNKKRVGRGYGSKKGGHTTGRGQKGQKSRSGYSVPRPGFEGGAMPLARRIPKLPGFSRGFKVAKIKSIRLNLELLAEKFEDGADVTIESLKKVGLLKDFSKTVDLKILGKVKLTKKINVKGIKISEGAKASIEKAGGKVE